MKLAPFIFLVIFGVACSVPTEPTTPVVSPIQVESVDVLILESFPAQAVAHVRGVVGDGCSSLHSTDVRREGSVITITILRARPENAICTQQALLYEENIRLPGEYPPGAYVLRVNGLERRFTT